ncbi:hypothetical protein BC332_30401 [Capsicum chinense]|nr:hypothetical protein BC332_30401 [Capsicum chinense]
MVPGNCTKFLNITLVCCGSIEQYSFLILNFDPTVNCARYCNGFPDMEQLNVVKEELHMSRAPSNLLCREIENNRILEFCISLPCLPALSVGTICKGYCKSETVDPSMKIENMLSGLKYLRLL